MRLDDEWNLGEMPVLEEPEPAPEPEAGKPNRARRARTHPREGQVVRGSGPAFYLVENGERRLIPSIEAFYSIGLRPVQAVPDAELEAIPMGDPFPNPVAGR